MNLLSNGHAIALAAFVAGCSSMHGDDVTLGPEPPPCTVLPGEDVCKRFADAPPRTLSAVANVTAFAGLARTRTERTAKACEAIVLALGGTVATDALDVRPRERMDRRCRTALALLEAKRPAGATLEARATTCSAPVPLAACALPPDAAMLSACSAPSVTVRLPAGATDADQVFARAAEAHLPAIFAVRDELEPMAELATRYTRDASSITELPARCIPSVVAMLSESVDEVSACIATSAEFASLAP